MPAYEITSVRGGISDYEDKGIQGSFKYGKNLDIRKQVDSLSANQALVDIGNTLQSPSASVSPSSSVSPSASVSPSPSRSVSPSSSPSPSAPSPSASVSPSASKSPSASQSLSASVSPSSSVSPSTSPSAGLSTVFADLILFFVKCSDGNTYGFGNAGHVYKINSDFYVTQVYDVGQRITGAYEWYSSEGKTYLYFATRTNLHRKEIPGNSTWNDVNADSGWPKTNLTSNDWHTMREAGGNLIICNHNYLALVGYDDSYTNEALDLIPGNIAKTLVERDGRTIVGTVKASDEVGINAMIDSEVPLAQIGEDGDLFFSNMADSVPIKKFPGGGQVNPGGVMNQVEHVNFFEWEQTALSWIDKQAVGNLSLWGVYGATSGYNGIYSYGRKNKNHPFVMNLEYEVDVDEIGALGDMNGTLLVSYRDGTDFGVKKVDSTTKATAVYEGLDFKSPIKKPVQITAWNYVELYMKPLPSGTSVEFWYRLNKNGSFVRAYTADSQTSFSTSGGKKAVFRIGEEGEIFEPRIVLNPSGNTTPEIYRTRAYFE